MPVAATFLHLLDDAAADSAASGGPAAARDGLVGSRVVRDTGLAEVGAGGLPLTLVVTGGAGQVAGPLGLCARRGLRLAGLHLTARDPGDPLGATRRLVAALDEAAADLDAVAPGGHEVAVRIGLPADRPGHGWLAAADEVAAVGHGLLLPTTDPARDADAAVDAATVVAWLDAALSREVPFALAAATHPAVRLGTGHGLLNLLLATRSSLDGAGEEDLVWLLDQTDGETLVDLLTETGDDAVARARRWLTSAAVTDAAPVSDDLRGLGLLT